MFGYYESNRWDFSITGHYLIPLGKGFTIYPLFGRGVLRREDRSYIEYESGNLIEQRASTVWEWRSGVGVGYKIKNNLIVNVEFYQMGSRSRDYFNSAGIAYQFNRANQSIVHSKEGSTSSESTKTHKKGDMSAGAHLVFEEFFQMGIGAKFRYHVSKRFRLESSFNYLFKYKCYSSRWDLYENIHLVIPVPLTKHTNIYPFIGFGLLGEIYGGKTTTHLGCNFGYGIEYRIVDNLIINVELNTKAETKLSDAWAGIYSSLGVVRCF
jgi:opacity protein-like surface antigen